VIAALLGAQAGIRYAEQKNTHPATSETFVGATLHDVLELTLRLAGRNSPVLSDHEVDQRKRERFDRPDVFAIEDRIIEGRQGDQSNRNAEHNEPQCASFEVAIA
jgi:hypothetical protein